jgi:hypothetical protein
VAAGKQVEEEMGWNDGLKTGGWCCRNPRLESKGEEGIRERVVGKGHSLPAIVKKKKKKVKS